MSLEEAKVIITLVKGAAQLDMLKRGLIGVDSDDLSGKVCDALDVALTLMDAQLELEANDE